MKLQQQQQSKEIDKAQEVFLQKMRGNEDKRSPKVNQATDLLQAFAPDPTGGKAKVPDSKNRSMTAANLIDAIIVHQINQSTEETPTSNSPAGQNGKPVKPSVTQSGMIPSPQPYRPGPQGQMPYPPQS